MMVPDLLIGVVNNPQALEIIKLVRTALKQCKFKENRELAFTCNLPITDSAFDEAKRKLRPFECYLFMTQDPKRIIVRKY